MRDGGQATVSCWEPTSTSDRCGTQEESKTMRMGISWMLNEESTYSEHSSSPTHTSLVNPLSVSTTCDRCEQPLLSGGKHVWKEGRFLHHNCFLTLKHEQKETYSLPATSDMALPRCAIENFSRCTTVYMTDTSFLEPCYKHLSRSTR